MVMDMDMGSQDVVIKSNKKRFIDEEEEGKVNVITPTKKQCRNPFACVSTGSSGYISYSEDEAEKEEEEEEREGSPVFYVPDPSDNDSDSDGEEKKEKSEEEIENERIVALTKMRISQILVKYRNLNLIAPEVLYVIESEMNYFQSV